MNPRNFGAVATAALLTLCCLIGATLPSIASPREVDPPRVAPAWTVEFDGAVLWHRVTPMGRLIVSSNAGLHGVDPSTGSVLWRHDSLKRLPESGYQAVLNTPLVLITDDDVDDRVLILHTLDGRILFDSESSGINQVLSTHFLPRSGGLLIFGLRSGHSTTLMALLDIASGKMRWTNEDIYADENKLVKFAAALVQAVSDRSGIVAHPLEVDGESFLIASGTGIYRISTETGEFLWKLDGRSDASGIRFHMRPEQTDLVYVSMETTTESSQGSAIVTTYYNAYKIADGSAAWDKPIKLRGGANDVIFVPGGLIVASGLNGSGKLKRIDAGRSVWGKKGSGLKVGGSVVDYRFLNDGILLTTGKDSAWSRAGVVYSLNVLDVESGTLRFAKPLKVKGRLLRTEVVPRGVLYVTTSEVNILDLADGKPLHEPVVSNGSLVTADRGGQTFAFSQAAGALFVIDRVGGTIERFSQGKVQLEDKDVVDRIETSDDRITVVSSQNLIAFDNAGELLFHAHHASPRQPTWKRALLTAEAVRAGMASATSGVYSGAFARAASEQQPGSAGETIASELAQGYADLSGGYAGLSEDYFKLANARYKASATSDDFLFMMVRLTKGVGLATVSKRSGEIVGAIDLGRDREPSYQVDAIENRVYYLSGSNRISGFTVQPPPGDERAAAAPTP